MNKIYLTKTIATLALLILVSSPALSQQIIPDGTTDTNLSHHCNITTVTTNTIKGNSGFNSFVKFDVNKNNIVNLVLPRNTSNLVNLVHGKISNIQGTVNAIKNNVVGGNLYLVNPNGLIVGAQGKLNTGSLVVLTPTKSFMSEYLDDNGNISTTFTKNLMRKNFKTNPNAVVTINGELNAENNIEILAGSIKNNGSINSSVEFDKSQNFIHHCDLVNVETVEQAKEVTIKQGKIYLIADNAIHQNGTIITDQFNAYAGGKMITNKNMDGKIFANEVNIITSAVNGPLYVDSKKTNVISTDGSINLTGNVGNLRALSSKNVKLSNGEANNIAIVANNNVSLSNLMVGNNGHIITKDGAIHLKASYIGGKLNLYNNNGMVNIDSSHVAGELKVRKNTGITTISNSYLQKGADIAQNCGKVVISKSLVGQNTNINGHYVKASISESTLNNVNINTKGNVTLSHSTVKGNTKIDNTDHTTNINNSILEGNLKIKQTGGKAILKDSNTKKNVTIISDKANVYINKSVLEGKVNVKNTGGKTHINNSGLEDNVYINQKGNKAVITNSNSKKRLTFKSDDAILRVDNTHFEGGFIVKK